MLNENIVSLLIPCYNGEQFVERCLINVLEQEYAQYIELILVNDGSTDKTEEIIFQLQKDDFLLLILVWLNEQFLRTKKS